MPVVGIGASAGGVGAFQTLVSHIPESTGLVWVLIQHMAPDRESQLAHILERKTTLPVVEVVEDVAVEPDRIYVIAPGRTMTIRDGVLHLVPDRDPLARRTSIDAFFLSLAKDKGEHSGCALLSGAGTDGTIGLRAVKEAGGLTVTQTLDSAEYDSMLLSAIRTGLVDCELALEEMPGAFADHLVRRRSLVADEKLKDEDRMRVCRVLRDVIGHDFSGYKISTVDRRIRRRMQLLGLRHVSAYLERLGEDRDEAYLLFADLLIGVTQFFRDPEAFDAVSRTVLPKILEGKTADDEIRIWVPGCATGEEVYSLAIMLQEQAARLDSVPDLRIFGSDIDENALHFARLGRYPRGIAADVSPERLERFFEREDGTYIVRSQLREMCLFARHNMLGDPPFSRIDLISCRNVLIYLNVDLQRRLMPVFHYALRADGFLFLGPAENASQAPKLFAEIDRQHRIFRRTAEPARLPEFPLVSGGRKGPAHVTAQPGANQRYPGRTQEAVRRLLERYAPTYVVIDQNFDIIEASARTGAFLELPPGEPRINLAAMARSGLAIDIKAAVARVAATGESVTQTGLAIGAGKERKRITLTVEPLPDGSRAEQLYVVVFHEEAVAEERSAEGLKRSRDEDVTRALEHELQTTKERLQSTVEELETSDEELRASNEELASTNEELQSSNEELETSREELQSINEELQTVNSELKARVEELTGVNNDLKNLLANTRIAMLFLDTKFRITNFTPPAKPLFRLRDRDIGRPLDELADRMDHAALKKEVQAVIASGEQVEHEVRANGGQPETFIMRILPYRDEKERIRGAVLTFIDITERKRDEERLAALVSELNHRVKNTLFTVQALVHQTASGAPSVAEFESVIQSRIGAMAAAHNLLSEGDWKHAGLRQLAGSVLAPFAETGSGRLTVSGPEIEMAPSAAVAMGMILHELATNAAKYGAWSVPEGSVALSWGYLINDGGALKLNWTEEGGPPISAPARQGFGLTFIRRSTEYELHGHFRPEFAPAGFRCSFDLPAGMGLAQNDDPHA
jgi:two-component system, chemotaxis family, CheB/CheR fusion protein